MRDDGDVTPIMSSKNSLNRILDAPLCVYGALPSANALFRFGKEGIRHFLELFRRQETSRAPVVFTEVPVNLNPQAETCGENASRLNRLRLGARPY